MERVRIDKWLWAARFFKTRSIASKACELGRIGVNGRPSKPAHEVRPGDMVKVKHEGGDREVEVLALSDVRGPAPAAQALYRETEASIEQRQRMAEARRLMPSFETAREGRPSKRDRRNIDRLRGRM
jgi:ribosome-associated heat shock protein Hsp15